jgi:hypothetical protein
MIYTFFGRKDAAATRFFAEKHYPKKLLELCINSLTKKIQRNLINIFCENNNLIQNKAEINKLENNIKLAEA